MWTDYAQCHWSDIHLPILILWSLTIISNSHRKASAEHQEELEDMKQINQIGISELVKLVIKCSLSNIRIPHFSIRIKDSNQTRQSLMPRSRWTLTKVVAVLNRVTYRGTFWPKQSFKDLGSMLYHFLFLTLGAQPWAFESMHQDHVIFSKHKHERQCRVWKWLPIFMPMTVEERDAFDQNEFWRLRMLETDTEHVFCGRDLVFGMKWSEHSTCWSTNGRAKKMSREHSASILNTWSLQTLETKPWARGPFSAAYSS